MGKEETQVATRAGQVVRLGVDREQPWIARNARVEVIDERNEGGDPARALMHDRPLMLAVALWILTDIALLYF